MNITNTKDLKTKRTLTISVDKKDKVKDEFGFSVLDENHLEAEYNALMVLNGDYNQVKKDVNISIEDLHYFKDKYRDLLSELIYKLKYS